MRENVQRLRPELWRQKNWLLKQDDTPPRAFFSTSEFFIENNMTPLLYQPARLT
jgi:hypothetical protein